MASSRSTSIRYEGDLEMAKSLPLKRGHLLKLTYKLNGKQTSGHCWDKPEKRTLGKSTRGRVLSRVFSEDYERVKEIIFDPRGSVVNRWNKCFLVACLVSLFVDPLFFYLPGVEKDICIEVSLSLKVGLTVIRSMVDVFYMIQVYVRFRTAYVAPSSRVFGRGELIVDPSKIASRYLYKDFWLDMVAAQPLPQVLIWAVLPNLKGSLMIPSENVLRFIITFQYILRLYLTFPLSSQIIKATGVVTETAWAGAAYNLTLYMLASHVLGACWYLLSIERQEECWKEVCTFQQLDYEYWYFGCKSVNNATRIAWLNSSNISTLCHPNGKFFKFGIYSASSTLVASKFFNKYFYCLWWGLRNLSSLGQNLLTSTYVGEINFAIIIAILGLVLFALLIGNMQTYLQSTTMRLEEWRIRRTDTEQWMHHRQLPHELKQCVRRYDQYRWLATRGVDEEVLLKGLPVDLRRDIKRHLCLDLVRQVPLFDQMDETMLDAICERLKPSLSTPGTSLVREGYPVGEMLFIVRGHLDSYTTNGGRTGFFNSCQIGPGDFCGEELLTWALDPRPNIVLPSSTRTVKAITEVEAFALIAEDLKFVASQFRRLLHSKQLRYTFRFHSHQWRTWAACFIQAAWFRYRIRKETAEIKKIENLEAFPVEPGKEHRGASATSLAAELYAAKLATSTRRSGSTRCISELEILSSLQKPVEPDFTS